MWLVKVPLYRKDYWERDYQCLNDTPRRTLHGKLTQWGKTLQEPPIYFLLLIRQLLFENLTQVFFKKLISVALSLFCGHKKSNAVSIRLWPSFVLRALLSNPSARLGFRLSCVRAWRHARLQRHARRQSGSWSEATRHSVKLYSIWRSG